MKPSSLQRLTAEFIGTAFLLATVVGSGVMAEKLAAGNTAIALLGNTIPTGAILFVLITMLGPISGAHFNPAVTVTFFLKKEISLKESLAFIMVQILAGVAGVLAAHMMFDLELFQFSEKIRTGPSQWFSEWVATFGLVLTILGCVHVRSSAVPAAVGLYITAAYWFTASTSFANPAVTIARGLSNTFAGIQPPDVPVFIIIQIIGAVCALQVYKVIFSKEAGGSSHAL